MIIDGISLSHLLKSPRNRQLFLKVIPSLNAVCIARCSPAQKRELTAFIKNSQDNVVLSIGDGANDLGMIEEANLGIGIEGKDSLKASLASDISLKSFKYLTKLILYHGRLVYKSSSKMSMYIMHRGVLIATMQFSFCVVFYLIDVPLFNGILMFGYMTFFTSFPVLSIVSILKVLLQSP